MESLYNRCLGKHLRAAQVWQVDTRQLPDPYWAQAAASSQQMVRTLGEQIQGIERQLKQALQADQEYAILQTMRGVERCWPPPSGWRREI